MAKQLDTEQPNLIDIITGCLGIAFLSMFAIGAIIAFIYYLIEVF